MSLREQAELDLAFLIEDSTSGFGWPAVITDPSGTSLNVVGLSNDISQVIDPDTGMVVSGRLASFTVRMSTLTAGGLTQPKGIADAGSKPWIVAFDDIGGVACTFKVRESNPDRALGVVSLMLEVYG